MYEEIKNPDSYEICQFDGTSRATVYIGGLTQLRQAMVEWRTDGEASEMLNRPYHVLTLGEIRAQLANIAIITVIIEGALSGSILQSAGDDTWIVIGNLGGYAG